MKLVIHTDGGARGNPGPAAVGVVIEEEQQSTHELHIAAEFGKTIGKTTNNIAEYTAVIEALLYLRLHVKSFKSRIDEPLRIDFFLDSTLVVNQLNGLFKVKDAHLRELLANARLLEQEIGERIMYHVIPREQNRQADLLVNQALDQSL